MVSPRHIESCWLHQYTVIMLRFADILAVQLQFEILAAFNQSTVTLDGYNLAEGADRFSGMADAFPFRHTEVTPTPAWSDRTATGMSISSTVGTYDSAGHNHASSYLIAEHDSDKVGGYTVVTE